MLYKVSDRETIPSLVAAVGFTAAKLAPTTGTIYYALIQAVGGNVRFCIDGSIPSISLGLRLPKDSTVEVWGTEAMANFLCIDDGGTAKLEVVYMGVGV